jgi:quercetin dioxygenase-like cupin family protein
MAHASCPLFGYILEGELTVDYGTKGRRTYRKGDGFAEAMNEAHNGHNMGQNPVRILPYSLALRACREVLRRRLQRLSSPEFERELSMKTCNPED